MAIPWHKQKVTLSNLLICATACVLQLLRAWMCANNNHTIQPLSVRHGGKGLGTILQGPANSRKMGSASQTQAWSPQLVSRAVGSIKAKGWSAVNWWNAANRELSFFLMPCFPLDSLLYRQPTLLGCDCSGNSQGKECPGILKKMFDSHIFMLDKPSWPAVCPAHYTGLQANKWHSSAPELRNSGLLI